MGRIMTKEKAELIAGLERFPNPNAVWSAFQAGVIEEGTVHYILRDRRNTRQKINDAIMGSIGDSLQGV